MGGKKPGSALSLIDSHVIFLIKFIFRISLFIALTLTYLNQINNLRPSHVVLPKIGISRFFRDFTQKLGFQAKYMDFRHWPHLQPMQATPLLTASHRILSSVARLLSLHKLIALMKTVKQIFAVKRQ